MFNLEEAVQAWSRSVHRPGCGRQDHLEELQDHLYCEIERLQEQGMSAENAFLKATEQLGKAGDLSAEYAKNNNVLDTLCILERAHDDPAVQQPTGVILAHSLIFAAVILAVALLVEDGNDASMMMFVVLIPLWFATFLLIPGVRHSAGCEWRAIQRLLGVGH